MENKKLLKFLYKDITEMEEIFAEKAKSGFDNFEIEFIQSRFAGAKQIIQILNEKENEVMKEPGRLIKQNEEPNDEIPLPAEPGILIEKEHVAEVPVPEIDLPEVEVVDEEPHEEPQETIDDTLPEEPKDAPVEEGENGIEDSKEQPEAPEKEDLEMEENTEPVGGGQRLGDRFSKEKSVNDLLANGSNKLEYKISNSPVTNIQAAIGINDRYQYIRELFDGSADRFTEAVTDLDKMNTIQEAVAYLQLHYKWKKTETSLKFVNLVKRRFANG